MEILRNFLKTRGFVDSQINTYTNTEIDQIVSVINGDFTFAEESGNVANYAGMCIAHNIHPMQFPTKNCLYYFHIACSKGVYHASNNIGDYYRKNNDYKTAIKYYFESYYEGNMKVIRRIREILNHATPFSKEIKKSYQKITTKKLISYVSTNKDDKHAILELYKVCMETENYVDAEKYLLQIAQPNEEAIILLAKLYKKTNRLNDSVKQYVKAYELNPQQLMLDEIKTIVSNQIQLYFIFSSLTPTNELNAEIHTLLSIQSMSNFVNRKNILSKTDDCPICYENKLLIPMECAHFYCESCYVKINRCAFCRSKQ